MDIYEVGGAVRDALLGLPVKDRDWVVVGSTRDAMLTAGYRQVGRDFPVFLHPQSGEEYALARTERKRGLGHTGFVVHASPEVTLEEDLARRDLTINAIARGADGRLVDPYGGERDLNERWLRHVSPAFREDPLRVLRVARFAARFAHLGFRVAPETRELMQQMAASGELETLTPERVWQECERALQTASPGVFFEVLADCHAFAPLFPELDRQTPEPGVALTALARATRLSEDAAVRLAAFLAALSTPACISALAERLRLPVRYRELATLASRYTDELSRAATADAGTLLLLLEGCDALRRAERFAKLLLACEAVQHEAAGSAPWPAALRLLAAREAAAAVDAAAIAASCSDTRILQTRLREARLAAINALLVRTSQDPAKA